MVDDAPIAFRRQRDSLAEPVFFFELHYFSQGMSHCLAFIYKSELLGLYASRRNILDVSFLDGVDDWKAINPRAGYLLPIGSERSRSETRHLCPGEAPQGLLPSRRNVVMAFIHNNQIEKIRGELRKP